MRGEDCGIWGSPGNPFRAGTVQPITDPTTPRSSLLLSTFANKSLFFSNSGKRLDSKKQIRRRVDCNRGSGWTASSSSDPCGGGRHCEGCARLSRAVNGSCTRERQSDKDNSRSGGMICGGQGREGRRCKKQGREEMGLSLLWGRATDQALIFGCCCCRRRLQCSVGGSGCVTEMVSVRERK